jgi:small subunit ribosomal protein S17
MAENEILGTEDTPMAAPVATEAPVQKAAAPAVAAATEGESVSRGRRKERIGKVTSDKMQKTVVVENVRQVAHSKYKKYFKKTTKFVAHSENNDAKIGDTVRIMETRPLSKTKRWRVVEILERAK